MTSPADFYPLIPGLRLEYATKTPASSGTMIFEVLSASGSKALCRHTAAGRTAEFEVVKRSDGVYSRGFKEFPLPPEPGSKWEDEPRSYRVESDDELVSTPGGTFVACLKVSYLIAGGDGGGGCRWYAPGVGFIREDCGDVGEPFTILLTRAHLL